jgi:hypothetical protein
MGHGIAVWFHNQVVSPCINPVRLSSTSRTYNLWYVTTSLVRDRTTYISYCSTRHCLVLGSCVYAFVPSITSWEPTYVSTRFCPPNLGKPTLVEPILEVFSRSPSKINAPPKICLLLCLRSLRLRCSPTPPVECLSATAIVASSNHKNPPLGWLPCWTPALPKRSGDQRRRRYVPLSPWWIVVYYLGFFNAHFAPLLSSQSYHNTGTHFHKKLGPSRGRYWSNLLAYNLELRSIGRLKKGGWINLKFVGQS